MKRFTLVLLLALAGCSGTQLLYRQASTPVQYVKVVLLHHNAIGEQVADLRADPSVNPQRKAQLLELYRATVCDAAEIESKVSTAGCVNGPAEKLEAAAKAYESAGNATNQAEMQKAVNELVSLLVSLIPAVNGAK